jgi:uncharacterized protein YbjT (DUF2867 family)
MPITFLRPAWFMENSLWDVAPARESGVIPSFLQPLDKPVPMVATADIGRVAAELLQETWSGRRVVELEGPHRVTPNQIAATFADLLGRPVRMEVAPRETWEPLFKSQGMKNSRLAFGCWTDSTKAGSSSRAVRPALERESSRLRPCSKRSSNARANSAFRQVTGISRIAAQY